jgi:hypothetical protein
LLVFIYFFYFSSSSLKFPLLNSLIINTENDWICFLILLHNIFICARKIKYQLKLLRNGYVGQ